MDDPIEVLRDFAAGVCDDPACQDCQEDHLPTIANAIDAVLSERDRLWDAAAALREENARLIASLDRAAIARGSAESEIERLTRERDEARAEVEGWKNQAQEIASSNADHVKWHREMEAEVARLEGLILDSQYGPVIQSSMALCAEARRIRAQREGCCAHAEADHETVEYRGSKPRACMHTADGQRDCECKEFRAQREEGR